MGKSLICDENFFANNQTINSPSLPVINDCYRETVIPWVPVIFFWIMSPIFLIYTERFKKREIAGCLPWTKLLVAKFSITIIVTILSIINIVYAVIKNISITRIYSILWIITFIGLFLAQYISKFRGIRTSGIIFNTWLLFTVSCLPQIYFIFHDTSKNINLSTVVSTIQFIFLLFQTILFSFADKGNKPQTGYISPELYSSFLSRITLWWFNAFAWLGSKGNLEMEDLYDLNVGNTCGYIEKLWEKYWTPVLLNYYEKVKTNTGNKKIPLPSVCRQLFRMFKYEFISAGAIKMISDILQFINPFILKLMIDFVSDPKSSLWLGLSYGILMFVVSELRSFCVNYYFYIMFRLGTKIQTTLTSAVYKKTLRLSNVARKDKTVGEIVNLMAIDIERFQMITSQVQQYWSSPFQIILALIFLYNTLGYAAIAGTFVMFVFVFLNYYLSVTIRKYQIAQMKYKDERVKMCNEVLNGMKVVKLYAWEIPMSEMIESIRKKELECIRKASIIRSFIDTFNQSSSFLVAFFTFLIYTLTAPDSHYLTPQVAFVSLTLFNIIRSPITMLGMLINETVKVVVSNNRLKEFLTADELDEDSLDRKKANLKEKTIDRGSISIDRATFSWDHDKDNQHNLSNINIDMESGHLIVIIGRVGSGKSSLLSGILGEMSKIQGTVEIHGTVAYFPQQPWIQNLSLKENILFGEEYKERLYKKVIECCALKPDIDILPNGDNTEIGEKGINMSGGQKARIGLARAVYSNSDIYLFDDPLSAVDSHVGKHIFEKVLGPFGILRNKTRVLVTNNTHILDKADLIIMMEDCKVKRIGKYDTLINDTTGVFNNFIMTVEKEIEKKETETEEKTPLSFEEDSESINTEVLSTVSATGDRSMSITSLTSSKVSLSDKQKRGVLMTKEHTDTGSVKKIIYLKYFKATKYYFAFLFAFGYMVYNGLQLGRSLWLSAWSDDYDIIANNGTINPSGTSLGVRLAVYGSFGIAESLGFVMSLFALIFGGLNASKNLHSPVLYNIMRSPMSFFDTTPIGRILNRFGKDIDVVDVNLPMSFRYFVMCLCQIIVSLTIIVITTPIFASVIIPLVLIYGFSLKLYVPTSRQLKRLESVNRSPIYSHFSESIQGSSTIRGYGKVDAFIKMSDSRVDRFIKIKYLTLCANRWLAIRLEFIGNCVLLFTVLFSTVSKELGWITSSGLIAVSITYSMNITEVLNFAVRQISELETNIVSVERLIEYCNTETDPDWRNSEGAKYCSKNWPLSGEIIFKNYSTAYRAGLELVIKNINLHIKGGEKVGIVGRTGAGKSSLTLALFRMIEPVDGTIVIDNVDISKIGLHDLRSHITVIPQDPVLFSGTLRFNLDPFNVYSDDEIWSALEKSHLKKFVLSNNQGLEFIISESGSNISVGTCQLICLARAILRKTKILVLDEATAAIDYHTDQLIQETIRKEFASSTVLAIAHRLNTIMDYDRIVVLDHGIVIEFDTPNNLLNDKNSTFYSMAQDAKLKEA